MVHYAGYTPRFHPSDFETRTRDGVGADRPITYEQLKPHYERVERELPVSGQLWPWGDPHDYPHAPHPVSGAAERASDGARRAGVEMRVGPVATPTTRVWGTPIVFIADGSALPTQGAANTARTIMAAASRLAERLETKRGVGPTTATAR